MQRPTTQRQRNDRRTSAPAAVRGGALVVAQCPQHGVSPLVGCIDCAHWLLATRRYDRRDVRPLDYVTK